MYTTVRFMWILCAVAIGTGQEDTEQLVLKPIAENHVRALGGTIFFACEVLNFKDDVDYSIRWFSGSNQEVSDTSGRMYIEDEGPSSRKLYITKIDSTDAGTYSCRATINGEEKEKTAKLSLFKEITFDNAPTPQNPKIYTNALISCAVSGEPKPQVSWRFGGKRIQLSGGRYKEEVGRGITITNITLEDNGEYICRAEVNADGRYSERKITVGVYIPPEITTSPGKVNGVEGQTATFKCDATGLPKPQYEFIKGSETAKLESTERVVVDKDAGTLTFTKLEKSDEGRYTCRATNDVGDDTAIGHLHVLVKPEIVELANITETEGGTATLVCRSRGDPEPEMSFEKVGQEAYETGENDDGRIVVTKNEGLLQMVISNLEPSDTANYLCKSKNSIGHHEMTGSLTVQYKPKFVEDLKSEVYTWAGRTTNITCQANGSPTPSLQWLSQDRVLSNNDNFQIFDLGSTSYLQVTVRDADQSWIYATYVCRAMNKLDSKDYGIQLKRASAPSNPLAINSTHTYSTSVELSIEQPEEDGGMPVTGYIVEYEDQTIDFDLGQPVRVKNLKPNSTYTLSARAKNEVGASNPLEYTFTTELARRPYAVEVVSDTQGPRPYEYKVQWEISDNGGLPITGYQVKVRPVKSNAVADHSPKSAAPVEPQWISVDLKENSGKPIVEYLVKNLKEETSYEVEIRAQNSLGWSDANNVFIFTTSKDPFATTTVSTKVLTTLALNNPAQVSVQSETNRLPVAVVEAADESKSASVSFATVIAIVAMVTVVALLVMDLACFSINKCGLTWTICGAVRGTNPKTEQLTTDVEEGESEKMLKEQATVASSTPKPSVVTKVDEQQPLQLVNGKSDAGEVEQAESESAENIASSQELLTDSTSQEGHLGEEIPLHENAAMTQSVENGDASSDVDKLE